MQRGRDDVIRPLVRQLQDVLAQIGLHRFQAVMLQPLVEIDLLGGHGFRFHDQVRAALLRQAQDEIGDLGAVLAIDHLAAVRLDVALELFQVMIQIVDGVLLEGVGLGAQFLVIGQRGRRRRFRCDFPSGGRWPCRWPVAAWDRPASGGFSRRIRRT